MPKGKVVADLTNIIYTGASTTFWTLQVYEWLDGEGLDWLGTWNNKTSTFTNLSSGTGTGIWLLVFEDKGNDIDIVSGDTIELDNTVRSFVTTMPDIVPTMTQANTSFGPSGAKEYWLFLATADGGGNTSVPFEPDRAGSAVTKALAFIKDYGYVLEETEVIGETRQIQDVLSTEETFTFKEGLNHNARITGPYSRLTEDVLQITEVAGNGLVHSVEDTFVISEEDFKHGDWDTGRANKGGSLVSLTQFAYDNIGFTEGIENAGGDKGDESGVSWFFEVVDPIGISEAITFNNQSDPTLHLVTDIIDFNNRGIKSLEWIHVDWDVDPSNVVTVAIDYRYVSSDSWTRSAYKDLNQENMAYMGLAGIEFRVIVNCEAFANIVPNGPITVTYKRIDKRGIRGIDAN